jgi:hypothetical protein
MRNSSIEREAPAVVPARHVPCIGLVEDACSGEPTQHSSAHLLLHRREIFSARRCRLGEAELSVFAPGKHPIDDAAMEVDSGPPISRGCFLPWKKMKRRIHCR